MSWLSFFASLRISIYVLCSMNAPQGVQVRGILIFKVGIRVFRLVGTSQSGLLGHSLDFMPHPLSEAETLWFLLPYLSRGSKFCVIASNVPLSFFLNNLTISKWLTNFCLLCFSILGYVVFILKSCLSSVFQYDCRTLKNFSLYLYSLIFFSLPWPF